MRPGHTASLRPSHHDHESLDPFLDVCDVVAHAVEGVHLGLGARIGDGLIGRLLHVQMQAVKLEPDPSRCGKQSAAPKPLDNRRIVFTFDRPTVGP